MAVPGPDDVPQEYVLLVGDPIDGLTVHGITGPDDPRIEERFGNDTWWVAPVRPVEPATSAVPRPNPQRIEDPRSMDAVAVRLGSRVAWCGSDLLTMIAAVMAETGRAPAVDGIKHDGGE